MLKTLRAPEGLFAIAMWVVSIAFASFLMGLGGRIIADLPGVPTSLTREQFMDPGVVAASKALRDSLRRAQEAGNAEKERAALIATASQNAYTASRTEFDAWIATRTATTDPRQDPEVVRRTRQLDTLGNSNRAAQRDVERIDSTLLHVSQGIETEERADAERQNAVDARYQREVFKKELGVFGIRLALTLPLLLVAGWLVARKRKSEYWPLARGFVLFAVFAFFVELVPYLPSYGGYVRYAVGIALTAVAAHYAVKSMRRYLAQRRVVEQQSEQERRATMGFESALKKMAMHQCPGCERPITSSPGVTTTFCVFCGLRLFDNCASCNTTKNAFFQYCPTCGTVTDANHGVRLDTATTAAGQA